MKRYMTTALLGTAIAVFSGAAIAEEFVDFGKNEFMSKCAVCHGEKGDGDGPLAGLMYRAPADLTTLTMRNEGVFPLARLYEVIDGRVLFPVHGTREMPIWGRVYQIEAADYYVDMKYDDERFTRTRILGLLDYLYRIQVK